MQPSHTSPQLSPQTPGLAPAIAEIRSGAQSCVVLQKGRAVYSALGMGVRPLMQLYKTGQSGLLNGAIVADKVIGKAAAMLLVRGQVAGVYGEVMSEAGRAYLAAHSVPCAWGTLVPLIQNRTKDGPCPIERSVLGIDDAEEGFAAIEQTIAALMAQKAAKT